MVVTVTEYKRKVKAMDTPTLKQQVLELSESVAMLASLARNGDHSTATLTALETLAKFVKDGLVVLDAQERGRAQ